MKNTPACKPFRRYFLSGVAVMQFPFLSQHAHPLMQPPFLTLRTTLIAIAVTIKASAAATIIVPAFSAINSIKIFHAPKHCQ
jgi:hypothetical protein